MKKILAIDDNSINLELIGAILKTYYPNYIYIHSLTGEGGIEKANEEKPELILLDILMPGLNGFDVCRILKSSNRTKHIPILMVSALGQDALERTKGLDAGADAFISKPFIRSELRARINVALRIKEVEDLLRKRNENLEFDIKNQTSKHLQNETRFIQISENAREFYWEVDADGVFIYVSPVVEQTLNISPLDIIGKENFVNLFQLAGIQKEKEIFDKNKFNNLEVELNIDQNKLWLSVSGFSVIDKNGVYKGKRGACYDITRRKKAEIALKDNLKQIKNYQTKLKKLNSEITLIEERERRRIAENLHDSLGQTLSLAYLNLSSINDINCTPDARKLIKGTSELLNKAIDESRTLTYDLSPPILYELGLVPAIKWKLEQIEIKTGIETILTVKNVHKELKTEYNIFLYRIVNELFTNINKHANATKISVQVFTEKGMYNIIVEDDGIGFNVNKNKTAANTGGYGLMSIVERLDSINGSIKIHSTLNNGTKAKIIVPLSKTKQ
ncbi:MAG: response regulator [Draconibacterium sp.]|nr:response regulator [Draconibacterium sp.]